MVLVGSVPIFVPLNSDNRVVAIYLDPVGITFDVTEFNFVMSELTLV